MTISDKGKIPSSTTCTLIDETSTGAGITEIYASIESDSVLVSFFAEVVTGTLDVSVYTLTEEGKEVEIITFPQLTAPTSELLLKKAALAMTRVRVKVVYSGISTYEVRAKSIAAGQTSVKLLGATEAQASQATVPDSVTVLVASSVTDRSGMVIKNNSTSKTVYVGFTPAQASSSIGYPIGPKEALGLDVAGGVVVYAISDTPSADIRILEAGG